MARFKDLSDMTFGRLTVICPDGKNKSGQYRWKCKCSCGNIVTIDGPSLTRGLTTSCGCVSREMHAELASRMFTKHGDFGTKLYQVWGNMIQRCENPNSSSYPRYGGRGIRVCESWKDYKKFKAWAIANGYEEGLTIDRIDYYGPYSPANCRWAGRKLQANNTRRNFTVTYDGRTRTLSEWCEDTATAKYETVKFRLEHGHTVAFSFFAKPGDEPGCTLYDRDGFMVLDNLSETMATCCTTWKDRKKKKK